MRWSRRYVMIRIISNKPLLKAGLIQELEAEARRVFGEMGLATLRLQLIDSKTEPDRAIVRCNTSEVLRLKFILTMTRNIADESCVIFSERSSGTLKSLEEKHVNTPSILSSK
jgi:RNase P/RNase MRP subunit POP5